MNDWKPDWSQLQALARGRDDILEFAGAELTADLYPMGFWLRFETNEPALLECAQSFFGRFPRPASLPATPDIVIRLLCHDVDEHRAPVDRARSVYRMQGEYFYVTVGRDAVAIGDQRRGRVMGFLPRSLLPYPDFIAHHFVASAYVIIMGRGFVGFHSAGLVKNERAVLLRAAQGAGKSTLAYAAVRRGYQLLGEDQVWLHWNVDPPEWWGVPWTISLLPDARDRFPELAAYTPTRMSNGELKIILDLDQVAPGAARITAVPGKVAFLERGTSLRARVIPLEPPAAFERLLNPLGEPAGPSHVGYTTAVEQLLRRPAYVLRIGTDLDDAVAALDALLAS